MPRAAASRLFHTIVVVGASLGCGSSEQPAAPAAPGPDASEPPTGSLDASGSSDVAGDAGALVASPVSICDCPRPGEFRCHACASGDAPIQGRCQRVDGTECFCDKSVPIAAPTDCAHPEQFVCSLGPGLDAAAPPSAQTVDDWFAFVDCRCDATGPLMASQCTCEQCTFQCATSTGCDSPGLDADASLRWSCACMGVPPPVPIK
jgi:hypothetical protein